MTVNWGKKKALMMVQHLKFQRKNFEGMNTAFNKSESTFKCTWFP